MPLRNTRWGDQHLTCKASCPQLPGSTRQEVPPRSRSRCKWPSAFEPVSFEPSEGPCLAPGGEGRAWHGRGHRQQVSSVLARWNMLTCWATPATHGETSRESEWPDGTARPRVRARGRRRVSAGDRRRPTAALRHSGAKESPAPLLACTRPTNASACPPHPPRARLPQSPPPPSPAPTQVPSFLSGMSSLHIPPYGGPREAAGDSWDFFRSGYLNSDVAEHPGGWGEEAGRDKKADATGARASLREGELVRLLQGGVADIKHEPAACARFPLECSFSFPAA